MIQFAKRTKRGVQKPIEFLRAILDDKDPGTYIIREANRWNQDEALRDAEEIEHNNGSRRSGMEEGLVRRIEKLVSENRLSLAAASRNGNNERATAGTSSKTTKPIANNTNQTANGHNPSSWNESKIK